MKKQILIPIATVFMFAVASGLAFADLNAQAVVTNFNSMNGGRGFDFVFASSASLMTLTTTAGTTNVNNTAYAANRGGTVTGGRTYFYSFCVNPSLSTTTPALGKLNYEASTGRTYTKNANGTNRDALSLGAAYLYKQYATSTSLGNVTAATFTTALQELNGTISGTNWNTNMFLAMLLSERNDQNYWKAKYDTRHEYSEMGNYVVFVMNVTNSSGAGQYQDFLYITTASGGGGGDVPEPATLLLWSLGGMGLAGSWARKRRMKKLALS